VKQPYLPDRRGRSSQPGIESWHCFSSGPFYDPDRISLGPIVGVDEHLVAPGAGFDWHAHRGVHIASWVLEGTLQHEDSNGEVRFVTPGALFVQSTGREGIRHREWNASGDEPLRFVQITVLGEADYGVWSDKLPAKIAGVTVDVGRDFPDFPGLALVLRGDYSVEGVERMRPGVFVAWDFDPTMSYDPQTPDALVLGIELDPE
jgi:hypothetical protein